jgi:predicted transcriptional regulator
MSKSVYSVVLNDEVVEAIDALAYRNGTNRSGMINQILAERVSYVTPEKRMSNIIDSVEKILNGENSFQMLMSPGDSSLMFRSAVKYKYNPSVKYSVSLKRGDGITYGELKAGFRTQNAVLLSEINRFLNIWVALEEKYLSDKLTRSIKYAIGEGNYTRELCLPQNDNDNEIGEVISFYIQNFDNIMKTYFIMSDNSDVAKTVERDYVKFLKQCSVFI